MFSTLSSTQRRAALPALCIVSMLLFASCALHQSNTLASGPRPTAQSLIQAMQKNFRNVKSFHVLMQVQNAGTAPAGQVQIRTANGDVVMPDEVKAQATIILSGQAVQVNLISIGESQFITDPITGQWRVIKGVLDPRTLTNPNTGVISLISKVQHLSQPTANNVNNTPCWQVSGQLDAKYLAFITGGGVPAGTLLQTSACIGQSDSLPYRISITGQAAAGDTTQTTRTFNISNYNEKVSISAPQL